MPELKCDECYAEGLGFMIPVKRQKEDDAGAPKIITETWCFTCVFKRLVGEYNETQQELRAEARDLRFMTDSDKKLYAFRPPKFGRDDQDDD